MFLIASFYLIQCNYSKENPGSSVPGRSNYPGGMSSMSIVKVHPALCTQHGVLAQSQALFILFIYYSWNGGRAEAVCGLGCFGSFGTAGIPRARARTGCWDLLCPKLRNPLEL